MFAGGREKRKYGQYQAYSFIMTISHSTKLGKWTSFFAAKENLSKEPFYPPPKALWNISPAYFNPTAARRVKADVASII
jgi:hypothetical protein